MRRTRTIQTAPFESVSMEVGIETDIASLSEVDTAIKLIKGILIKEIKTQERAVRKGMTTGEY